MRKKQKHFGMSLTEILVVMAVIAILMGVSIPAAKQLANSFESGTGVRQLINAALSSARSIAIREQAYAGVRFQEDKDGNTYIIFIVHDKVATGDAYGFRAVKGRKPMQLPEGVGIGNFDPTIVNGVSVAFSPQGKLTIHQVQCLKELGPVNDMVFNDDGTSMFVQDSGQVDSVQSINIIKKDKNESVIESNPEYISPYTGELVMEYREQKP